jgi:hypothetical protein
MCYVRFSSDHEIKEQRLSYNRYSSCLQKKEERLKVKQNGVPTNTLHPDCTKRVTSFFFSCCALFTQAEHHCMHGS